MLLAGDVIVLDPREDLDPQAPEVASLVERGARVLDGAVVTRADGRRRVRTVSYRRSGATETTDADLLVVGGVRAPALGLLAQAGVEFTFDEDAGAFLPVRAPDDVRAAGAVAGARSLDAVLAQGRLAGLEAAVEAGHVDAEAGARTESLRAAAREAAPDGTIPPLLGEGKGKQFACFCMD